MYDKKKKSKINREILYHSHEVFETASCSGR